MAVGWISVWGPAPLQWSWPFGPWVSLKEDQAGSQTPWEQGGDIGGAAPLYPLPSEILTAPIRPGAGQGTGTPPSLDLTPLNSVSAS